MKQLLLIATIALSGCSTIGDLEVLNDVDGLREVRETAHTLGIIERQLGARQKAPVVNTGAINRKYGEVKGLDNRKYDFHDLPHLIQSLDYILR